MRKRTLTLSLILVSLLTIFLYSCTTATVTFDSNPQGATVYLDGTAQTGVTPITVQGITPGTHTIKYTLTGYQDLEFSQTIASGASTITKDLIPSGGSATVTFESEPSGAYVYIDDVQQPGKTPVTISGVTPGVHKIFYQKAGYPYPLTFSENIPPGTSTVWQNLNDYFEFITNPSGANVYLDGVLLAGQTPINVPEISAGIHNIEFTKTGYYDIELHEILSPKGLVEGFPIPNYCRSTNLLISASSFGEYDLKNIFATNGDYVIVGVYKKLDSWPIQYQWKLYSYSMQTSQLSEIDSIIVPSYETVFHDFQLSGDTVVYRKGPYAQIETVGVHLTDGIPVILDNGIPFYDGSVLTVKKSDGSIIQCLGGFSASNPCIDQRPVNLDISRFQIVETIGRNIIVNEATISTGPGTGYWIFFSDDGLMQELTSGITSENRDYVENEGPVVVLVENATSALHSPTNIYFYDGSSVKLIEQSPVSVKSGSIGIRNGKVVYTMMDYYLPPDHLGNFDRYSDGNKVSTLLPWRNNQYMIQTDNQYVYLIYADRTGYPAGRSPQDLIKGDCLPPSQ